MIARVSSVLGVVAAGLACVAGGTARADDRGAPEVSLDAPAPPTLPALAHTTLHDTFEITGASIDPGGGKGRAGAFFMHDDLEYPLVPRTLYMGAAHDVVVGEVPGVGHDFFPGSPELWVRALWSSLEGLSAGGGLGVVVPVPHTLPPAATTIFNTVRVVRPWDAAYFTDRELTLRPWIDVRHLVWRFVFQLRQGLDVSVAVRGLTGNEQRVEYVSRTTFYAGFRVAKPVGIGLEVWEIYQVSANLCPTSAPCYDDDKRAAFSVSPSIRFMLGRVDPAFSVLLPVSTPLRGDAVSYWALRFNVGFSFEASGINAETKARGIEN